ncbi:hypothetical protein [Cohnella hongkongensis]|uniref:Uncharacterized protein n=1 Tax=Cohnella hongkongensis TaxID=178337 RepID=A0ABV9FH36_9BACL
MDFYVGGICCESAMSRYGKLSRNFPKQMKGGFEQKRDGGERPHSERHGEGLPNDPQPLLAVHYGRAIAAIRRSSPEGRVYGVSDGGSAANQCRLAR